ncbi:hypothetical protein M406DRAFT_325261 [Cryphonectria parasitica EP155]|uniref:Uncharacterized protein n=1 Tax=Cryphonectria parasitica (strain ATCC 38755 / EP155) TaxID=660469 RepID=A0A9P4YB31_CRYP1|nr:uncharacterized protein M406DRAFT_325261 [Cryphonectria parasitica EP155]KAF3769778.1 hypothetical protein M406DRAFT_325261 [Cryphonectria parasitica EP155]
MGSEFPDGGICTLSCVKVHADLIYRSLLAKEYTTLDSYADLEQLELYEGQSLGLLGNSVKQRLLRMLQGEMEPVTEVASVMKIDGLCLGSMANCRTHDKDFAILTIHPDDWVAGQEAVEPDASWMKHGKLAWNSIPITNLEDREHGLKEALIGLPHKTCFIRAPSVVNGILSPVVDHYVIELEDSTAAPLLKFFPNACQFLATHLAAPRRKAMAHCKAGKSRGPAFTLAFMIYRYYHTVIENNPQYPSITPSQKAKVVDRLDAVINDFMGFLMEIRPCISADNKFRTQLRLWAWQLVHKTRPAINPERPRPGGGDMRDAAIIEFYIREQRPFRNLVEHWLKRRFSGETRWRAAEMEKARMEGTAKGQDPKVKMEEYIHYWKRVMQTEAEE